MATPCERQRSRSPHRQAELQLGCNVRLYGLKGAAELNGQCGIAELFVQSSGRWRIKLSGGQSKDLKAENLEVLSAGTANAQSAPDAQLHAGCKVKLHGLKSAVELNGQEGILDSYISSTSRWRVKLAGGQHKDLKPDNLEAVEPEVMEVEPASTQPERPAAPQHSPGCKVKIRGMRLNAELNGQQGVIEAFVESNQRWRVKLASGQHQYLKAEYLEITEAAPAPPPAPPAPVRPTPPVRRPQPAASMPKKEARPPTQVVPQPQVQPGRLRAPPVSAAATPAQVPVTGCVEGSTDSSCVDSPGLYIISGDGARVNDGPSLDANQVHHLAMGARIYVLEVITLVDVRRVRARIAQPPGWISLLNTETGFRFAVKDEKPEMTTQAARPDFNSRGEAITLLPGEYCGPDGRFITLELLGEGMYSTVWRCRDAFSQTEYAVKFTRANERIRVALEREIKLMNQLSTHACTLDPEGSNHLLCLAFPDGIEHRGHMGVVFETMKYNLLTALERHGQGKGLPLLPTVRDWARHLLLALRALRQAGMIHLDVKPENLLVSQDGATVKLADFGCTLTTSEAAVVVKDELMPRYYRAPEVILGQKLGTPLDMWSAGVTIYQMATDHFMFCGANNNVVLHEMLAIFGAPSKAMLQVGEYVQRHFSDAGDRDFLLLSSVDSTIERKIPLSTFGPPPRPLPDLVKGLLTEPPVGVPSDRHEFLVAHFSELLCGILKLDPSSRLSPQSALNQRFFAKGAGDPMADLAALWAQSGKKT